MVAGFIFSRLEEDNERKDTAKFCEFMIEVKKQLPTSMYEELTASYVSIPFFSKSGITVQQESEEAKQVYNCLFRPLPVG